MSGRSCRIASTAAWPLAASPMTSTSSISANSDRAKRLAGASSSTTNTRQRALIAV
jgi:hypothetical protein